MTPPDLTPPGFGRERTSLAWWRTSNTAIGCALVIAKFSVGASIAGWIATGLAVACALVCALAARQRALGGVASDSADSADSSRARSSSPRPPALLGLTALGVALAASVLAYVIAAV